MPSKEYLQRKAAYIKRYQKEVYKHVSFKVRFTRKDILDKLDSVPNKSEYIVSLIEKDIAESKK